MLILATSSRDIGAVLFAIGGALLAGYLLYNFLDGRSEVGSEIELAANKKPYLDDEELETKKLDLSLTWGLAMLAVIGLGLPLYWLGEPGRQDGYIEFTNGQLTSRGEDLYDSNCAQCHNPGAVGGVAPFTVLDDGRFVASVSWKAPALTSVLYRFSDAEVRYILNFGRQNSPMPAWGAPGGGAMTTQEIDELIQYLQSIQLSPEEIRAEVQSGIDVGAREVVIEADPSLADDEDAVMAAIADYLATATPEELGVLVFNNPIGQGAYSCARCHTAGFSWDSDTVANNPEQPFRALIPLQVPGGGGFGPNLTGESTLRQFASAEEHSTFVGSGAQDGLAYGAFGQGDGGGQMPAFGGCVGDRDAAEFGPFVGFCEIEVDGVIEDRGGILTQEQIEAVVAYERSL